MSGAGGSTHASAVLRRRVKAEEDHLGAYGAGADDDGDAYWAAAPRLYDFSKHELKQEQQPPPAPSPSPSQAPAPAACGGGHHLCLLALQGSGAGWGVRKRVRYVGRHRAVRVDADHRDPPPAAAVESAAVVQGDEESTSNGKKGGQPEQGEKESEAGESCRDERKVFARTEKRRKRKAGRGRGHRITKRPKKIRPEERERNLSEEEKAEESSQGERKVVSTEEKRKKQEAEAEAVAEDSGQDEDERKVVRTETRRKRKTGHGRGRGITDQRPKKNRREEETRKPVAPKVKAEEGGAGARCAMVDRWTANRYAAAEASLLGIVRALGARAGQPVQRGKLRLEARKHIGDTGLLDHLLKHAANKVPPSSAERLRRRHNADGAMEYWLEPAELATLQREAGVADPYWVPPPGWKPGDPVSPDACSLEVKRQVEELATELAGVKWHMEQLMKAHQGTTVSKEMTSEADKAYIPHQEKYDCMVKANVNLEKQVLSLEEKHESVTWANGKLEVEVLFLKEKYEAVLEKNTRLEEQIAALSTSFLSLKEDLLLLNVGEQEQADLSVKEPGKADKQEGDGGKAPENVAVGAGNQLDAGNGTASSSSGVCAKRTSRKCSLRICKPQGTFQWPEPDTALPLTPTAEAAVASLASVDNNELHEYMMAAGGGLPVLPPTPPSASSSTNAASAKLPLLPAPAPVFPVQPPPPPPPATSSLDVDLQAAVQPHSCLDLQLRHTDTSSSSLPAAPCGGTAGMPEGKETVLDDGCVGTELALATPSH